MTKQELAAICIARLKAEYPDSDCTLDYDHAWQLLVSVRLAAQCTDARVNVVVQELFAKYPGVKELAAADPADIEAIVKPCGLGHSKARDISACMRMLRDRYDCRVPDDFNALLALPGVGRKSANLIMGDVFGTACHRDGHPLHPAVQPHRAGGQRQGAGQGRAGAVEDHPTCGGQRLLPPAGGPWPRRVHSPHQALLRQMLPGGRMPGTKGIFA